VRVKPARDGVAWVMVRLEVPTFVKVRDCVLLIPTWTLPKLTVAGFDVS
jgi:hypothetical protein